MPIVMFAPLPRTRHMRYLGLCHANGTIIIDPRQSELSTLSTAVHELLHHTMPSLTEKQVRRVEGVMAPMLWAMGYRRR